MVYKEENGPSIPGEGGGGSQETFCLFGRDACSLRGHDTVLFSYTILFAHQCVLHCDISTPLGRLLLWSPRAMARHCASPRRLCQAPTAHDKETKASRDPTYQSDHDKYHGEGGNQDSLSPPITPYQEIYKSAASTTRRCLHSTGVCQHTPRFVTAWK